MPAPKVIPHTLKSGILLQPRAGPSSSRAFLASDIRTIYSYPPVPTTNVYVGVISLGGTLTGTIHPLTGILTGGDVQNYWTSIGIPPANHPVVRIVRLGGSILDPSDLGSTAENTLDVEMVGACCPTSKLTIIFYLYNQYRAPAHIDSFYEVFNAAINKPVNVRGAMVKPSIISCSWGASESLFGPTLLTKYDTLFAAAKAAGVTITCASGDYGSSNGTSGTVTDFPSSSSNVISCGGTTLICPNKDSSGNYIYDGADEKTWSYNGGTATGGGISGFFKGPPYPRSGSLMRQSPDISLVADPATGVQWLINGASIVYGGTSIVSPAIAGLMACVGSPPKSLLSKLYALPSNSFYDIVAGQNGAYSASAGYDNCTGLGSVNGTNFIPSLAALVANPVTSVSVTGNVSVRVGSTTQLTATTNANATNKGVTWHSTTANATVSNTGLVTGISVGTATIVATTLDGFFSSEHTLSIVTPPPPPPSQAPPQAPAPVPVPPPSSLILSRIPRGPAITSFTMRRNTLAILYSNRNPTTWTSSRPAVASVSNGLIFGRITKGSTTITARSGSHTTSILLNVQ
jgi:subtilase family serine protease